jgi:hypothetical protein
MKARLNLSLDTESIKELKVIAAMNGWTLNETIDYLLKLYRENKES